ncbi:MULTISPECIES: hypothetical protein [unclassified Mesorhizobium]|uniref:hypothetical protein n=1 Tax=unclassified Mesorhizobium TaxID=325217 RepID=UPI00143FA5B9|nr:MULTISPECIES: hypothetical protein [unclassified Mesorhizobium]
MTVGSITLHRPIILPLASPASSAANEERHSPSDANTRGAVLTGLQIDASPGPHKSKTMTAAVAGSMLEGSFVELKTLAKSLCFTFC